MPGPIRLPVVALAALFALIVLAQGISAPFQKDAEPQSAQWMVSIVRDGRWLLPRDYYGFVDRKPPLFYWLSALLTDASGGAVDETRARLVSLAAGTGLATLVLLWTAANIGEIEGWLAFLFLLGIYGFSSRATLALTDMMMTLIAIGAYLTIFPLLSGERSGRRVIAAGVLLGMGILTKGPVAVVLVALAALIFMLTERQNPLAILKDSWPWQIAAIAIAIAACWYIPATIEGGRRVVGIFLAENFGHFMPRSYGGTGEAARPIWYIVARTVGGSLPIVLLIPAAIAALVTGEIPGVRRRPILYQSSFALAVITFFSIASAKRDDYILPAMPGIAIMCAAVFRIDDSASGTTHWGARLRNATVVSIAVTALAIPMVGWWFAPALGGALIRMQSSDEQMLAILLSQHMWTMGFFAIAWVAALLALFALRRDPVAVGASVGVIALAGSLLFNAAIRPALARARSLKAFSSEVRPMVGDAPLFLVHEVSYELSFYWGGKIPTLAGKFRAEQPADRSSFLIAYDNEIDAIPIDVRARMKLRARAEVIGGAGPPALYEISPDGTGVHLKDGGGAGK
ncbi:MAG TPA: phospholipid carrier-dependent glycosyltransferase [Candidatus Binataceae bacterium]|nr:phospholipid carrier-dependent glycosyltransferase [Candidatus Binataceae bacterium]